MNSPGLGVQVSGQVFEVDASTLQPMDAFEEVGQPTGYVRVEVELELDAAYLHQNGEVVRAHVYMK